MPGSGLRHPYPIGPLSSYEREHLSALLVWAAYECAWSGRVSDLEPEVARKLAQSRLAELRRNGSSGT